MKIFKRLFLGVLVLGVVLVVAVVVVLRTVDPNDYKEKIQQVVHDQTGRDLQIVGDINLSYFPWVGLSLGRLSVAQPPGFAETSQFAQIDSVEVKVKVLPLLRKQVKVSAVEIDGLVLDLQRDVDGEVNWQFSQPNAGETAGETVDQAGSERAEPAEELATDQAGDPIRDESTALALQALTIGGIKVKAAHISWSDKQGGSDAKITNFNLNSGAIVLAGADDKQGPLAASQPIELNADFDVVSNSANVAGQVEVGGVVGADLGKQHYQLDDLTITADLTGASLPAEKLDLKLSTGLSANLATQQLLAKSIALSSLGVTLKGQLQIDALDSNPTLSGKLSSDNFSPRELFKKLAIELPSSADSGVLGSAAVALAFNGNARAINIDSLQIQLDDTSIDGSAALANLAASPPPVQFKLNIDQIDIDRYLPQAQSEMPGTSEPSTSGPAPAGGDTTIDLPVELLRGLDIDGQINLAKLTLMHLRSTDIAVPVQASGGKLSLAGLRAKLYDGQLNATLALDVSAAPRYVADIELTETLAEPLLADLLQDDAPISGRAKFDANINTHGASVNALIAALDGGFSADMTDGAINGINLAYQIRRAKSVFGGQKLAATGEKIKTDFSALHIGGKINQGVISSEDLDLRSPALRVAGAGSVDLPQKFVDYTLRPGVVKSLEGQGGKDLRDLAGVSFNIPIRGHFDELTSNLTGTVFSAMKEKFTNRATDQARAVAKAEADKVAAQARVKAEAEKARAQQRAAELQQEAELKLREEQSRAERKLQQQADKLKESAKDRLKNLLK